MKIIRTNLLITAVILSLAVCVLAAPLVQRLLPANNDVKGFTVMPDSLTYGKGNDVAKIYDGGFEVYTNNGVVDAARQMYKHGNDYVEVTIHTMKSDRAASAFLRYWQNQRKAKGITRTKSSASFTLTKPNVMTYCQVRKYLVTVSAFYAPARAEKDVKAFAAAIEKKVVSGSK